MTIISIKTFLRIIYCKDEAEMSMKNRFAAVDEEEELN